MINNSMIADTLEAAADLYEAEKYDWCQGNYHRSTDQGISICASQAIRMACGEKLYSDSPGHWISDQTRVNLSLLRAAFRALNLTPFGSEGDLIKWNDQGQLVTLAFPLNTSPRRTKQEVIDLFKEKAKDLRNQS